MARGRRYTATERARAIGLATVAGSTTAAASTGVPESTLRGWLQTPEAEAYKAKARDAVAADFWAGIQLGLQQVMAGLAADAPLRDKAITLGILYDKHALLTGGATSRSGAEERPLTAHLSDEEKGQLRDWIVNVTSTPDPHPADIAAVKLLADGADALDWDERAVLMQSIDAELARREGVA